MAEITKIVIKLKSGKKLEFTEAEVKDLFSKLKELFDPPAISYPTCPRVPYITWGDYTYTTGSTTDGDNNWTLLDNN